MAEQDKNLPLVVSEILIELHGLNSRKERLEDVMVQAVGSIQQLSKAVNRTAEVMLQQQQGFNHCFDQRQQESDHRFELLLEADRQQANRLERAIASIENRLERLDNR
ncbi:MAG: hypothetical protein EOO37_00295 [Cytophagaceae bacterium]|nr:MAG: hypothetical protein EOO37_00295 [Cytophagaceae bacterium]